MKLNFEKGKGVFELEELGKLTPNYWVGLGLEVIAAFVFIFSHTWALVPCCVGILVLGFRKCVT